MTIPEPVPASSPTRTSRDTTAGTVRAAMSATDPGGRSLLSVTVDSLAPGSVTGGAPGPASGGRCSVSPSPAGRPKASASAAGGGAVNVEPSGNPGRAAPENAPDTPSGRPKAVADSASTAGRSSGRGPNRGAVPF